MVSANAHDEDQYGPAPGDLELVREFVNTDDFDTQEETLTDPEALATWLAEHGFEPDPAPDEADLARAIEFREAVRALLLANVGEPLPAAAAADLERAAARSAVAFGVEGDGRVTIRAAAGGVDGLVARLLAAIERAQVEGNWHRLKACPAETCAWAFWDESRNSSRTWCSMGVCGNRAKTRRYRSRRRSSQRN